MNQKQHILIVDDDHAVHDLLKPALSSQGRDVDTASSAQTGLQKLATQAYDLVLISADMPGKSGEPLLDEIRATWPGTRVVLMTATSTPEDILDAIRSRAFCCFSKPFQVPAVRDIVDGALASRPTEDDDIEVISARPNWLEFRLRAKAEVADRILQFLREMKADLPKGVAENTATAFREILMNAIEHGAGADPEKRILLTFVRSQRALMYYVRDPGPGFSFENLDHAAVSNSGESPIDHTHTRERMGLRPGGFGILMTRQLVDELIYNERGNEVLLIKYLDAAPRPTRTESSS